MGSFLVGAARCPDLSSDSVEEAVHRAVEAAGGWPSSCRNQEVLLKANLLAPRPPEDAVTTHPEVLRGVIRSLRRKTAPGRIRITDNPGYIFATQKELLFRKTGMARLAEEEGVDLGTLSEEGVREVDLPQGRTLRRVRVASRVLRAPCLINVPKLKTHVETEMTGCLKNLFGIADTETRKRAHSSPDGAHLAEAVVDLYTAAPPVFHVLDAVLAMEGNGPSHGTPRFLGWILAGANGLAVDLVAARVMGYRDPLSVPVLRAAAERGLGPRGCDDVELRGASWAELPSRGFRRSSGLLRWIPVPWRGAVHRWVDLRPRLDRRACVRCRICQQVCPVDAIAWDEGPRIDERRCVRCLCCHEMCPNGAMGVVSSFLASWARWTRGDAS